MKLLVDSGSTKADWIALDDSGKIMFTTQSLGLNPEVLSEEEIISRLNDKFDIEHNRKIAKQLFFYGAGCGTERMQMFLTKVFKSYFLNADVKVYEDTYAAVFATTPIGAEAIVCILGTGSNCSYYDGAKLHQKVQSLGYICMDDCSGNRFGRHLLRAYFFNRMDDELRSSFEKEFDLDADTVKHHLYKEPNPNAYLAKFAKFLIKNKNNPICSHYIESEMDDFVHNYIMQYDNCKQIPVHFVGSIAYYLRDELAQKLAQHGIKIGNVLRRPIDGLISYHRLND